jgi:clan AA aspartic protease
MLGRPDRSSFEEIDALVDTGAAYTWVPSSTLQRLGAVPHVRRRFRLATGADIERPVAEVPIRINGETLTTLCIFGDEGTEALLGALTLEQFGVGVDPINRKLVPVVLPEA